MKKESTLDFPDEKKFKDLKVEYNTMDYKNQMMQTLDEIRFLSSKIADKRNKNKGKKDISNILEGLEGIASRLSSEIKYKE